MFQRLVNGAWQPFHRSLPCLGSYACADATTKRPKKRPLQSGLFASAVPKASERMKLKSRPLFACKTIDVGPSRIGASAASGAPDVALQHVSCLFITPSPGKISVKSSNRWLLRLIVLLIAAVIAGSFFRYEYTSDKSVRVDRLTGAQEVFCQTQQSWTSVAACYAPTKP